MPRHTPSIEEIGKQLTLVRELAKQLKTGEMKLVDCDNAFMYAYVDENGQSWWMDTIGFSRIYDTVLEIDGISYNAKKLLTNK